MEIPSCHKEVKASAEETTHFRSPRGLASFSKAKRSMEQSRVCGVEAIQEARLKEQSKSV